MKPELVSDGNQNPRATEKRGNKAMEEKKSLASTGRAEVDFGGGTETLLLPRQRSTASGRGAVAKTACSRGEAGNPAGPGSYSTTKHSPATPEGKNNECSPAQDQPQIQAGFGCTGEQEHWGAQALKCRYIGLPNTKDGP